MHLRCEGICKSYDGRAVLRDVSIEAPSGCITVLLGPNGAGKTTLLRILALIERPDRGTVSLDGRDAADDERWFRREVAMVFQRPVLLDRSVEANIAYGVRVRRLPRAAERIDTAVRLLGLERIRTKNARKLSEGEKKRTALAMALALDAPVLFLDECFANLDPVSAKVMEDAMSSLRGRTDRCVVLATHSLARAERYGDRIYLIRDGAVAESGTAAEFFRRPSSLYAARYTGARNLFSGTVERDAEGTWVRVGPDLRIAAVTDLEGSVHVLVPPTDVVLSGEPLHSSALNLFCGTVADVVGHGAMATVVVDIGVPIEAVVTRRSLEELRIRKGAKIYVTWKASAVHVIGGET